jgi:hypothetical protein
MPECLSCVADDELDGGAWSDDAGDPPPVASVSSPPIVVPNMAITLQGEL